MNLSESSQLKRHISGSTKTASDENRYPFHFGLRRTFRWRPIVKGPRPQPDPSRLAGERRRPRAPTDPRQAATSMLQSPPQPSPAHPEHQSESRGSHTAPHAWLPTALRSPRSPVPAQFPFENQSEIEQTTLRSKS